jgi:hypothetical protein
MIAELLKVADLLGLTDAESTRMRPVHWYVDLDQHGRPIQLSPTVVASTNTRKGVSGLRGKKVIAPRLYHMQILDDGIQSVCTNQHNWLPDFLVWPVGEAFPTGVDGFQSVLNTKRRKTWEVLFDAHRDLPSNQSLPAIIAFLKSRPRFHDVGLPITDSEERQRVLNALAEGKELISFRVCGRSIVNDCELLDWWAKRISRMRSEVCSKRALKNSLVFSFHPSSRE